MSVSYVMYRWCGSSGGSYGRCSRVGGGLWRSGGGAARGGAGERGAAAGAGVHRRRAAPGAPRRVAPSHQAHPVCSTYIFIFSSNL